MKSQPSIIGPMALIDQYNALLPDDRRRLHYVRSTHHKKHIEDAVVFLKWCAANDVRDPLLFVRTRMTISKHVVPFAKLASAALLDAYRERFAPRMLAAKMRHRDPSERIYLQSLMLNARAHEIVRRDYVSMNQTHLCLAQPELSGSYHPASPNCASCAHGAPCAQRLNEREGFNVVALRLRRLDLVPADVRALLESDDGAAQSTSVAVPQ